MSLVNKAAIRFGTLALALGLALVANNNAAEADTLIAFDYDNTGTRSCTGRDWSGTTRATAARSGAGAKGTVTAVGGSGMLRAGIGCGFDCNSLACMVRWRRSNSVTSGSTNTVFCAGGESYLRHSCEIWTPDNYATIETPVIYWLGPLGSSYEQARMYPSAKDIVDETATPAQPGCGPTGCF